MNKIIVVYGDGNIGKTTVIVINDIYDDFIQKGASLLINRKQEGANPKDFSAVLSYKGESIAFLSMGDYRKTVDNYVNHFASYDIFITALNTSFKEINSCWLKNADTIYKIKKTSPSNTDNSFVMSNVIDLV